MNWGLLFVIYWISVFYFLLKLNIYLFESLEGEIKGENISLFMFFIKYYRQAGGGGILPRSSLPFPCFPSQYVNPKFKKICFWRNISSTILVLHFIALIIITTFFAPEVTEFFNRD